MNNLNLSLRENSAFFVIEKTGESNDPYISRPNKQIGGSVSIKEFSKAIALMYIRGIIPTDLPDNIMYSTVFKICSATINQRLIKDDGYQFIVYFISSLMEMLKWYSIHNRIDNKCIQTCADLINQSLNRHWNVYHDNHYTLLSSLSTYDGDYGHFPDDVKRDLNLLELIIQNTPGEQVLNDPNDSDESETENKVILNDDDILVFNADIRPRFCDKSKLLCRRSYADLSPLISVCSFFGAVGFICFIYGYGYFDGVHSANLNRVSVK